MGTNEEKVKLKHGTASRIARRLSLSVNHVSLVIKGERKGSKPLVREIEREKQKQNAA